MITRRRFPIHSCFLRLCLFSFSSKVREKALSVLSEMSEAEDKSIVTELCNYGARNFLAKYSTEVINKYGRIFLG